MLSETLKNREIKSLMRDCHTIRNLHNLLETKCKRNSLYYTKARTLAFTKISFLNVLLAGQLSAFSFSSRKAKDSLSIENELLSQIILANAAMLELYFDKTRFSDFSHR